MPDPVRLLEDLNDYLAGELDPMARDAFEEALFTVDGIAELVAGELAMHDGIRTIGRAMGGGLTPVMGDAEVEKLRDAGHDIVEYALHAGQVLDVPMPEHAEYLVARLALPPDTEGRLLVEFLGGDDEPSELRLAVFDACWDSDAHQMTIVCERHMADRDRVTCFRVRHEGAATPLADYTIRTPPR